MCKRFCTKYFYPLLLLSTVFTTTFLHSSKVMDAENEERVIDDTASVPLEQLNQYWATFTERYGLPFAQYCISLTYFVYANFTFINVVIFLVKYVPTAIYTYKFIKDIYSTSRERIRQKQMEIEDIQLQIQIVKTKLCVRDAEFTERAEQLRRGAERLRRVRARVRDVIAADKELRRALDGATAWDTDHELHVHTTEQEEDREFIVELIKEPKYDQVAVAERPPVKMDCGEFPPSEPSTPTNSIYSSLSDVDVRQDCRVKIVKVTNVYKVAYLKNYIKQKRLRRANKQALLKKKMESIKNLLDDWQKTLSMVINSKLQVLNMNTRQMDTSQEAMGDYSKSREYSDSDSDIRNSSSDMCYDEYSLSWTQNPYRPYSYNYEDVPETAISREYCDSQDYEVRRYDRSGPSGYITAIMEETSSQIAIEKTQDEESDLEYPDLISL